VWRYSSANQPISKRRSGCASFFFFFFFLRWKLEIITIL
jgi:hypothetical protein